MTIPQENRNPRNGSTTGLPPVQPAYSAVPGTNGAATVHPFTGAASADARYGYAPANLVAGPQQPQPGPYGFQYPMAYQGPPIVIQQPHSNGLGVAGFVTGLLGLILFWVPALGLILGFLGIILGGVSISATRKVGQSNGLGIAGLILGIVSLIPAFLVLIAVSS